MAEAHRATAPQASLTITATAGLSTWQRRIFAACWLTWPAFLAYSVGLVLFAGLVPGLIFGLLASMLGGEGGIGAFVVMPLMTVIALIIFSTVYASFYVSYRDIFGQSEIV